LAKLYNDLSISLKYGFIIKINHYPHDTMLKKILIGVTVLVAGFTLGGTSFLLFQQYRPGKSHAPAPGIVEQAQETGGDFSGIVQAAAPAVVNISAVKLRQPDSSADDPFFDFFKDFFSPPYAPGLQKRWKEQSFGSGVIVSADGYVITNNHVVTNAEKIKVTLYDKRIVEGRVIGSDPKTDIAVIKIRADSLPTIPWGDSDALRVGEFVLAIGDPFGLSHTVTMGIISAVGRANVGIADYEDFIQTDAAINPGNSGGPLVNAEGNLIGINTAIFSRSGGYQGIGFAVPSNMARRIMEQLIGEGRVIRGWVGVTIQELTPELSRKFRHESTAGALVGESLPGSPAERAGITSGDIIVEFGGKDVEGPSEFKNMVARSTPGTRVPVAVLRSGKAMRFIVTVGELPREAEPPFPEYPMESERDAFYGLSVIALTDDIARQLNIPTSSRGVVVVGVQEGSPSDDSGLRRGDLILEVEGTKIRGIADFRAVSADMQREDSVLMFINRGGRKFFVAVLVS
jgi:serine protease Do